MAKKIQHSVITKDLNDAKRVTVTRSLWSGKNKQPMFWIETEHKRFTTITSKLNGVTLEDLGEILKIAKQMEADN